VTRLNRALHLKGLLVRRSRSRSLCRHGIGCYDAVFLADGAVLDRDIDLMDVADHLRVLKPNEWVSAGHRTR